MQIVKRAYLFNTTIDVPGGGTEFGEQDFLEREGTIIINKVSWDWQYLDTTTHLMFAPSSPSRSCEVRLTIQPQPLIPFIGEPPFSKDDDGGEAAMVGGYFYLYNPGCHIFEGLKCSNRIKVRASVFNRGANICTCNLQVLISAEIHIN
jgi:hypothetical protein